MLLSADDKDALQAAVYALKAITDGAVHLATPHGSSHPAMTGLVGVETHGFSGPHPSGDPALQVNYVCPPKTGQMVLTIRAWDAVAIGRALLTGAVDGTRVYAAVGTGVTTPRFVRTLAGAPLSHIVGGVVDGPLRFIVGTILFFVTLSALTYATSRYRVPFLPVLIPSAAYALTRLRTCFTALRAPQKWIPFVLMYGVLVYWWSLYIHYNWK